MNFELLRFWITLGAFAFMCGYVYEQVKGKSKIKEINKRIEFLKKYKCKDKKSNLRPKTVEEITNDWKWDERGDIECHPINSLNMDGVSEAKGELDYVYEDNGYGWKKISKK